MSSLLPFSYYDLIEACAAPGCPLCTLLRRDADRFMDGLLYESVNEVEIQRAFRASRGLCSEHSWQLLRYGLYVLGIAILEAAALDEVLAIIAENGGGGQPGGLARLFGKNDSPLADRLEAEAPCLVCKLSAEAEGRYLKTLADHLTDPKLEAALRASSGGLCLPHFRAALRRAPEPVAARLTVIQADHWQRLKDELESFKRKQDFQHVDEAIGSERDSWQRAIGSLAGQPGVFSAGRRDRG